MGGRRVFAQQIAPQGALPPVLRNRVNFLFMQAELESHRVKSLTDGGNCE
jgi:hypothetical protein